MEGRENLALILFEGGAIPANADASAGGNVTITAEGVFVESPGRVESAITANSKVGLQGAVEINAPDEDISGSITELTTVLVSPDTMILLAQVYTARGAEDVSSLTLRDRGSAPTAPGYFQTHSMVLSDVPTTATGSASKDVQKDAFGAYVPRLVSAKPDNRPARTRARFLDRS